ncbi:MAG: type I-E CRISPR-associated protein Cse1/CasA [Eubacteriaceae bacterium]|nr:type I-E CRISPR-associated protein Cse1/CasA [Eubacteriaceae bacterium]
MNYNLMYEPWIPVRTLAGEFKKVGIKELIIDAHNIEQITDASPMREYGIYRLICALLMDMLRPEDSYDIDEIIDKGSFDEKQIDEYISLCESEGVSFDLFDENRPFLQCAYNEKWDKGIPPKPVQAIDEMMPSGNNHLHFVHGSDLAPRITCEEAARALCAVYTFCTAGLKGSSNVYGAPPYFVMVQEDNLFKTLSGNILPVDYFVLSYDDPAVIWRYKADIEPGKKIGNASILFGMTFPTRRIRLVEEDGFVTRVYLQKGLDFQGYDSWTGIHVPYQITTKGISSLKPRPEREPWRCLGSILDCDNTAPQILKFKRDYHTFENYYKLRVYGVATSSADYLQAQQDEFGIPAEILRQNNRVYALKKELQFIEEAGNMLKFYITGTYSLTDDKKKKERKVSDVFLTEYFDECKNLVLIEFLHDLALCDIDQSGELDKLSVKIENEVYRIALRKYDESVENYNTSGRFLVLASQNRNKLIYQIKKKMAKEE